MKYAIAHPPRIGRAFNAALLLTVIAAWLAVHPAFADDTANTFGGGGNEMTHSLAITVNILVHALPH